MNAAPNFITRKPVPDVLDEDMSRPDLVDLLRRLRIDIEGQYSLVWLDRPVRDFLIAALTDSRRK
jgi:hypothetical protein